jgi:hypothetical protein
MMTALLIAAFSLDPALPCASCHAMQGGQWQASRHADSLGSPLYRGMREWARTDAGEEVAGRCTVCHSVADPGGSGRAGAVVCEACHQAAAGGGPASLAIDRALPVAAARAVEAPHPVAADPSLPSGGRCLACHAEMKNAAGVPVCTTGPEVAGRAGGPGCVSCHMPGASHEFAGATPQLLARAAQLFVDRRGGDIVIGVTNRGAGHALPTGSALRVVRLDVEFRGASGGLLGGNQADPTATFMRVLEDAEGNAPVPPWRASAVARDSRLAPGERRAFAYPMPPGTTTVTARLIYRRAPVPILERFGIAAEGRFAPVEMARFELPVIRSVQGEAGGDAAGRVAGDRP